MELSDETQWLVADLDLGHSPKGVLVVREARWQRIVGIACGLFVGIPTAWLATAIGLHDIALATMFAIASGISLGGAVWFLCELLSANFYYFALDSHRIYRRRGPGRLVSLPLSDLGELSIRLGTCLLYTSDAADERSSVDL